MSEKGAEIADMLDTIEEGAREGSGSPVRNSILQGKLQDLPPVISKTVRIFISSTFSDMVTERNALMENVYPKLKDFCRQYGLEFQVVDMRWGVREEAQDDHMTSSLCMREIHECQRVSMGPTFVVLFGQKYGYRPFPVSIPAEEFEALKAVLQDDEEDVNLLDEWFKRDDNVVPPIYTLLKISSHFPNYVNKQNAELQEIDRQGWQKTFEQLQLLLRHGAHLLSEQGLLTCEKAEKYFISVTEDEILHGIVYDQQRGRQICLFRCIEDLLEHVKDENGAKFIDVVDSDIDGEAQRLLHTLRDKTIPQYVDKDQMSNFLLHWSRPSGISESKHRDYIKNMCKTFYLMIRKQVVMAMEKREDLWQDALLAEVLQHAMLCENRCKAFHGRKDILKRIEEYMKQPQSQPMVIYGDSGSGKTSIMAMVAKHAASWVSASQPVIITRLLGTTPKSSSIFPVLQTICEQICRTYDKPYEEIQDDFTQLVTKFLELLKVATSEKPLVIILDSLDQLSSTNYPYRLTWLPYKLPHHVHFIVSTLPNEHKMLHRLRAVILQPLNFVQVQPLGGTLSFDIIKTWLSNIHQTLTVEQFAVMKIALNYCSLPLYAKLVFEEVRRWKSYFTLEQTSLQHTVKGLINILFDRIEVQHGKKLVAKSLSYLTASRSGLTEAELEDVLSLDDEVLDEIFVFWIPPIRRIPPLLWTRIRSDLSCYLVEREADGVTVLAWYHRQFKEVVKDRYLGDRNYRITVHNTLADFFLGCWGGGRKKPFRYSEQLFKNLGTESRDSQADRKLPAQPLKWKTKSKKGVEVHYNLRKLTELPYHLYRSERYQELWKEVFYNYRWLHAKLKATSVMEVMTDAMLVHNHKKGHKVDMIMAALRLAGHSMKQIPNTLAAELLGRLRPSSDQFDLVTSLVKQCKKEGLRHCALLPSFVCFDAPLESLIFCLEGHRKHVTDIVFSSLSHCLYSVSLDGTLIAWDVKSGEIFYNTNISYTLPGHHAQLSLVDPDMLVLENHTDRSPLTVFNANTGDLLRKLPERRNGFLHNTLVNGHYAVREGELLDLKAGSVIKSLACLKDYVGFVTVALTPNSQLLLVGQDTQTLVMDLESEVLHKVILHENIPSQIVITKDNKKVVIGYAVTCLVEVYDIDLMSATFGNRLLRYEYLKEYPNFRFSPGDAYQQEVFKLNLSNDDSHVLVNIKKLYLFVVCVETGSSIMLNQEIFRGHEFPVHCAEFAYHGRCVVGIVGNYLCIWNTENGDLHSHMRLIGSEEEKFLLAIAPSGKVAATASKQETTIKLWDLDKLQEAAAPSIHVYSNPVDVVHVVREVKLAYIKVHRPLTSRRGYQFIDHFGIDVWNLTTNHRQTFLPFGKYGQLKQMTTSLDGQFVILLCEVGNTAHIFIIDNKKKRIMAHLHQPGCLKVRMSYDSRFLLTEGTECRLWDIKRSHLVKVFLHSEHACFTTDFNYVVLIQEKKKLMTFNMKTGDSSYVMLSNVAVTALFVVPNQSDQILLTTTSPSGAHRRFTRIELWNFVTRLRLRKFDNIGSQGVLDISKDGNIVVDSLLQVFDLQNGKTLVHQCWTAGAQRQQVRITDDGVYVIWADTKPTDCVKAMRVKDGRIVAEVSTHSKVVSLNLTDNGYMVLVGCQDGHFLSFTLHNVSEDSDNDSNEEDTIVIDLDEPSMSRNNTNESLELSDKSENELPCEAFRQRSQSHGSRVRLNSQGIEMRPRLGSRSSIEDRLCYMVGGQPTNYSRQSSNTSTSSGDAGIMMPRIRSVSRLSLEEQQEIVVKVNNTGPVSVHYPRFCDQVRSSSDSHLHMLSTRATPIECYISYAELQRLDPLYQRPITPITDMELPRAGADICSVLENAGQYTYSISCDCDTPADPKHRRSSCQLQ